MTRLPSPILASRRLGALGLAVLLLATAGCGDYSGSTSSGDASGARSDAGEAVGNGVDGVVAFGDTVHPLLLDYCADCHAGAGPGFPSIAHADAATAHMAVVDTGKVNLLSPENSRLVVRLDPEQHHCWGAVCADDAEIMRAAIAEWADLVQAGAATTAAGETIASGGLLFTDGIEETGDERVSETLLALYEFKENGGEVARDTSGVAPAMDLNLSGDVEWLSGYGLDFSEGRAMASRETSRKLYDAIGNPATGSQQYTVEAWVVPDNIDQEGPARMVSYSSGSGSRNFTMAQTLYNYVFRNRSLAPEITENGLPELSTHDDDQDLQATLQHAVLTYDQYRGRRIYVNGRFTDDEDPQGPGRLWNWDQNHRFVLGNEANGDRPWVGKIRLAAVYSYALTEVQILQNFHAGVGKRLLMRFDVSRWLGAGSFLEFQVSELDPFSYLFCSPTLVSSRANGRVAGIRIAVNGQLAVAGQSFANVDHLVTSTRELLSPQCAIVAKDGGPTTDAFHVEFEILGSFENVIADTPGGSPLPVFEFDATRPTVGVRDFARINETMAAVTGVDPNRSNVLAAFDELEQQLPATTDLRTFASSHQVGISKLALEYCDSLVETSSLRASYFPGFDFGVDSTVAFAGATARDRVFDPLIGEMVGLNLASEPSVAEIKVVLNDLVDTLTAGCTAATCPASRTETIVKATCAAVLASGAVSLH